MTSSSSAAERTASIAGGVALILATVLFSAVFATLARTFDYPAVLDRPAAEVLPRLLALGTPGRAVWVLYGLVPLLLLPAAFGVWASTRRTTPLAAQAAVVMAVLSAACMMAGLLRWPSLHWHFALAYRDASPAARELIATAVVASNSLLGTFIGEFLGELFLNAFFLCAAWALQRAAGSSRRWLLVAGVAASVLGSIALLRNATPLVAPVAALNNVVLPLWMLVLGMAMCRPARAAPAPVKSDR